jgi:large subunit ribosomal protein L23
MKTPQDIVISPIISEKSSLGMESGKYTFLVAKTASKDEIKDAIEALFKVTVASVNTQRYEGKPKRLGKYEGKRADWKKAIITVANGQRIKQFEGV